ncbi:hypothetical protein TVAG_247470 [Trichomonas vaginalis G3]|nr:ERAD pathway [Trichomonas vaginalis G3]EAY19068.1 hypothetical protein TVAG_247470 [Trichomonas vaginalis G3]KAI5521128.1 ERAD pathway [Trichomonas vaginalis G3]|eukprot:XP_001580054.1 hypothetical protein [Trichomonas vaginalis G3]
MFIKGEVVKLAPLEGVKMVRKAADELNDPDALFNMGLIFLKGLGVTADPAFAQNYFQKAAKNGNKTAELYLQQ